MNRVELNESRLDSIYKSVSELGNAITNFKNESENFKELNNYYGSNAWFNDIDKYNKGKFGSIKAGVLSEDAVWNLNESISELIKDMEEIINNYKSR